jgi:hypothetical protein
MIAMPPLFISGRNPSNGGTTWQNIGGATGLNFLVAPGDFPMIAAAEVAVADRRRMIAIAAAGSSGEVGGSL